MPTDIAVIILRNLLSMNDHEKNNEKIRATQRKAPESALAPTAIIAEAIEPKAEMAFSHRDLV